MTKSVYVGAFLLLTCSGPFWFALADPSTTPLNAQCSSQAPEFGDKRDVTCVFATAEIDQRFLFKVMFVGSHDDTKLSMTASLNQQPLTCDSGSKMSSQFEDGEISLECRFSVKDQPESKHVLEMGILWTHAQYADFEFTAQQ